MREIRTRGLDPIGNHGRRVSATDPEYGSEIKMPMPLDLEGREAHEVIARRILRDGERLTWDRDLKDGYVFLVVEA